MTRDGQVVLFRFPRTNQSPGKLRPALVLRRLPGPHDDWLICMVSSRLDHAIEGLDEVVAEDDGDYVTSGLRVPSVIRVARLAVVHRALLRGSTGEIAPERLARIRDALAAWLRGHNA